MTVKRCAEFQVMCDPSGVSCDACVVRTGALLREAARIRVEARRRERALEGKGAVGRLAGH